MKPEYVPLRRCPFCGKKPASVPQFYHNDEQGLRPSTEHTVICQSCNAAVRQQDQETAERIWNKRFTLPPWDKP